MTCVSNWRYFAYFKVATRENVITDILLVVEKAGSSCLSRNQRIVVWVFYTQLTRARACISARTSSLYSDHKPASELICAALNKDVI